MEQLFKALNQQDHRDFLTTINRQPSDIDLCLIASRAAYVLNLLARTPSHRLTRLCEGEALIGEDNERLLPLQWELLKAKHALQSETGSTPTAAEIRARLKQELKESIDEGGDYITFLSYFEFVLERKEDPSLNWETYSSELDIYHGLNAILKRLQESDVSPPKPGKAKDRANRDDGETGGYL